MRIVFICTEESLENEMLEVMEQAELAFGKRPELFLSV